jgi:hypothetical protein
LNEDFSKYYIEPEANGANGTSSQSSNLVNGGVGVELVAK